MLSIKSMFLVTGLGNPTKEYEYTPHNAGYIFVDMLREYLLKNVGLDVSDWVNEKKLFLSNICRIKKEGELIGILQKPLTYMNNSGSAVNLLTEKYPINQYILVHDDLDIPLGKYKIQRGRSPKDHKGVLSVESVLKERDFLRVRLGIDNREGRVIDGERYVLMPYNREELEVLKNTIISSISVFLTQADMF